MEKKINPGFYMTLEERRNERSVDNTLYLLHRDTEQLLDSLFSQENMIISLPRWSSPTARNPQFVYTIRYSRNNRTKNLKYLFVGDYNPLVVYKNDWIVGVIYEKYYFSRNIEDAEWILQQFEEIEKDPMDYFSRVGERWGSCVVCGRTLTAEKSVELSIGPVCYSRLEGLPIFDSPQPYDLTRHTLSSEDDDILYMHYGEAHLNMIESKSMEEFSNFLNFYLNSGFKIEEIKQSRGQKSTGNIKVTFYTKREEKIKARIEKEEAKKETQKVVAKEKAVIKQKSSVKEKIVPTIKPASSSNLKIDEKGNELYVYSWPFKYKQSIKDIPNTKWNGKEKAWVVPLDQRESLYQLIDSLGL